ncbi:MAG: ProQ/FinO family protein [Ideonella sp.]
MPENIPNAEPLPDSAQPPEQADQPDLAAAIEPATDPLQRPAVPELSANACAARLAELFPAVFSAGVAKPLKLRIQADIQQRAPGVFTRKALSNFLHRQTTSTAYLRALANGEMRVDLDGVSAGEISDEHRQAAASELDRRRGLHAARRATERDAQRATFREAQQQAMREHAAQSDARRERAGLLRAFESTTLTLTNFCALKSIAPADLEATLALARQDRELAPPPGVPAPAPSAARVDQRERRDDDRRPRQPGKKRQSPQHAQRAAQAPRKTAADH